MDKLTRARNSWIPQIVDVSKLRYRCQQSIDELLHEPGFQFVEHYSNHKHPDRYAFKDNGANVLGIAHVDVAHSIRGVYQQFNWVKSSVTGEPWFVVSPALDDRLGVHILLDLLPGMGINVDILLTDQEESGNSTAQHFVTDKDYNWIFSFDRRGNDVVMYQYDTGSNRMLLSKFGFVVGWGTFSDIAYLEHLGVAGFNFGCGYYSEHTRKCHMYIRETEEQLLRFRNFWRSNRDNYIEYFPTYKKDSGRRIYSDYDTYADYGWYGRQSDKWHDSASDSTYDDDSGRAWVKDKSGAWRSVPTRQKQSALPLEVGEKRQLGIRDYDMCDYCGLSFYINNLKFSYALYSVICQKCCNELDRAWESLTDLETVIYEEQRFGDGEWDGHADWDVVAYRVHSEISEGGADEE